MMTLELIKEAIEENKKKLDNYYDDENDLRPETHPDIEKLRENILSLKIMYVHLTTGITDEYELLDLASNM